MALAANWNAEKHAFVSIPRKIVLLFPIYPSSTPPPPTDGRTPTDRHALFADEKASRGANTRGKGEREGSDEEGKQPTIKPSPSNIQLIRLRVLSLVCSAPHFRTSYYRIFYLSSLPQVSRRPEPLQPVSPPGAAQGALREAEADQRLRARHGHVRHHRHGARERALVRRGLHQGECVRCVGAMSARRVARINQRQ